MARRSMSVIDVASWVASTGKRLSGSRISNIYRDDNVFHLKLKPRGGSPVMLYVEPGSRIHVTRVPRRQDREYKSDTLQATLRKYLRNKPLMSVEQVGFDRIVKLSSSSHSLIVELLNRGILALLDSEGRIVVASRYLQMRDRTIKPKQHYTPPPSKTVHPSNLTTPTLSKAIKDSPDIVRGIVRGLGLPGDFAEEAVHRAGLELDSRPSSLSAQDVENLVVSIRDLFNEALQGLGFLVFKDGKPYQATSFKPTLYIDRGFRVEEYAQFDEALDILFSGSDKGVEGSSRLSKLIEEETARVKASMEKHRQVIEEYEKKSVELRERANWIGIHYSEILDALNCIRAARASSGWEEAKRCPFVVAVHPKIGKAELEIDGTRVTIDVRQDPGELIKELYRKAGELEGKAKRARKVIHELEAKLEEAVSRAKLRYAREILSRRPREWYERFHWTVTPSGMLVIAGKNVDQNESIVRKYLEEKDLFFHAVIHGAPATVLKTGGSEIGDEDIQEAARIAASYSRAWKAGAGHVDVFWVHATQVSKSPPSGEYLPKGSFMVYGTKNYVRNVPVRLYLGIEPVDGYVRIIVGTRDNVSKRSILYVGLQPGSMKKEEATSKIKERMKTRARGDEVFIVEAIPDEWIIERLPGKVQVTEWGRGDNVFDLEEFFSK